MSGQRRVLDIELERLALGELSPEREKEIRRHLEAEPEGMARLEEIMVSNEQILERYTPHLMAAQIAERARVKPDAKPSRARVWLAMPAIATAAAAAVLVWIFLPGVTPNQSVEPPETIILKGVREPALFVFRKGPDKEELLFEKGRVSVGDVIQLKYAARGAAHGVIFSIDGLGAVTLHFPSTPDRSTALRGGGARALPFSYELDEAPGFERFFFVTSSSPIDVNAVLAASRNLAEKETGSLKLFPNLAQHDFLLKKRESVKK